MWDVERVGSNLDVNKRNTQNSDYSNHKHKHRFHHLYCDIYFGYAFYN
jgi:hypothetical protein